MDAPARLTQVDQRTKPSRSVRPARKALRALVRTLSRIASDLRERVSPPEGVSADDFAQMLVGGFATLLLHRESLAPAGSWLLEQAPAWQWGALQEILVAAGFVAGKPRWLLDGDCIAITANCDALKSASDYQRGDAEHLYEHFLAAHASQQRRRKGVFFTPPPIVRFMLGQVDRQLQAEFGFTDGMASPQVQILDPAAGAGAFLCEAVTLIHERFISCNRQAEMSEADANERWSRYVVTTLLPRLSGIELMPTSCLLACLNITARLGETGFDFRQPGRIEMTLGNALRGPECSSPARPNRGCVVVVGNPPFSYLSENDSPWIKGLIRGEGGHAGYLQIDGERLGERKTWLHDDYVKFLRYSQWQVESHGRGIVAFVTNHGYLDNATFRILRQQLLRALPRISVVDLHGNRKKGEVSPDGGRDENVFGLDQGVAIGFFRRASDDPSPAVDYAEVWGALEGKLARLAEWSLDQPPYRPLKPVGPMFRWTPEVTSGRPEYARGLRLPDVMPVNTTAPVTARDGLVVAFTEAELMERMERFCDLSVPEDQIRAELFPRPRSARYPAGDTRGWKLAEARRRIAAESDLRPFIRRCLYRPFDWRSVFWHPAMIDWPRTEVMRHLLSGTDEASRPNFALIARRQMLPSQPCTYFWVTDTLVFDGIIRSDNRGSESVFPAWLVGDEGEAAINLNASLIAQLPDAAAERFAFYAYALFHAPGYRTRYSAELRRDFPRVMLPREPELFTRLVSAGQQLVDLHLLRSESLPSADASLSPALTRLEAIAVEAGFPQWHDGWVYLDDATTIAKVPQAAWEFRVGGHQVLRKWLADRRGRRLSELEMDHYGKIVAALSATMVLQAAIDSLVEQAGGWDEAFD